jgi:hypothetical protein
VLALPQRHNNSPGQTGTHRVPMITQYTQTHVPSYRHTHTQLTQWQASTALTPVQTHEATCMRRAFNPFVVGRLWCSRPIPLASKLSIHSLVIGGNLIPILPSQSQAPQSHQNAPTRGQQDRALSSPPRFPPPLCSWNGTNTHSHIFTEPRTCRHRKMAHSRCKGPM